MAGNKSHEQLRHMMTLHWHKEVVWERAKRKVVLYRSREGKQRWFPQQIEVLKRRKRCQKRELKKHQQRIHFCCNLAFAKRKRKVLMSSGATLLESLGKLLSAIWMGRLKKGDWWQPDVPEPFPVLTLNVPHPLTPLSPRLPRNGWSSYLPPRILRTPPSDLQIILPGNLHENHSS